MNRKGRIVLVVSALTGVVALSIWAAVVFSQNSKPTAEQVAVYASSVDLTALRGDERVAALRAFEEKINSLSLEERRKWRMGSEWRRWFDQMTESEKGQFIDATMPTGFAQVLNVFEGMPDEKRKEIIESALKELKATHQLVTDREPGESTGMYGTNPAPLLSAELEKRTRTIGLKTFYTESSAEAKAELGPFIDELQHQMQLNKTTR